MLSGTWSSANRQEALKLRITLRNACFTSLVKYARISLKSVYIIGGKEMLDNLREWISDNLRYILLGVAAVLILVIVFFAVRLVASRGGDSTKKTEPDTQQTTESMTEKESESSNLVRNQQDILEVITEYYTARADKDYDTLEELCQVFDEKTRSEIESQDAAIESYSNIITYSKAGMTEDAYVVYVYFDAKVTGIDTLAPSLRELYLITDEDGNLIISDKDSNAEQKAYIESLRTDDDVQALIDDVEEKAEAAQAQDEALKNFVESGNTSADTQDEDGDGNSDGSSGDSDDSGTASAGGTMMATTSVNVRGEPSADATLYGTLYEGMTVEVLENLDSGWSKIRYTTNGTTIEGYAMTQYFDSAE